MQPIPKAKERENHFPLEEGRIFSIKKIFLHGSVCASVESKGKEIAEPEGEPGPIPYSGQCEPNELNSGYHSSTEGGRKKGVCSYCLL